MNIAFSKAILQTPNVDIEYKSNQLKARVQGNTINWKCCENDSQH